MRLKTVSKAAVAFFVLALVSSGCVTHRAYRNLEGELESWQGKAEQLQAENDRLKGILSEKGARVSELGDLVRKFKENEELRRKREEAISKVFGGLTGVERLPGGGRLESSVFFSSGSANLTGTGQEVLRTIAGRLGGQDVRDYSIAVHGHTDSDPVRVTKNLWPRGNLELSGARALNVAHFLITCGVEAKRVSFAGFGEHRPIASNSSSSGKARNRRVEVLLSAEQALPEASMPGGGEALRKAPGAGEEIREESEEWTAPGEEPGAGRKEDAVKPEQGEEMEKGGKKPEETEADW